MAGQGKVWRNDFTSYLPGDFVMPVNDCTASVREARVRRRLAKSGYALRKSRLRRAPHIDDWGQYRIVDQFLNCIVVGEKFDWSHNDVEAWAQENR
jgi:hypothetical protein